LLDFPAPLFAAMDGALGWFAPAPWRLVLWGLIAAAVSMGAYFLLSPQRRIARTKVEALDARRALDAYDGEFAGAWPLISNVLKSALRQLGLVTWPAVVSSLPVLALLVWMSTTYGYGFPEPGADVAIRTVPNGLEARIEATAPSEPQREIVVTGQNGEVVQRLPWPAPVPTIHKRAWWNALIGNPAGYLPESGPLERIDLDLPAKEYLPLGPAWLRAWYIPFFAVLIAASIAIKVAARIE
jgi:hypothetical protein